MGEIEVIPQEMGRVFLNMVSNACYATDEKRRKAMENGNSYMPTLLLTTKRCEEHAEVGIRDNGMGMPAEVIEKIFLPFFTTKPTDKGTGLGLAMCSDIIRKHGGSIDVESEPGEFTLMTISIPLTPPLMDEEHQGEVPKDKGGPDGEDEFNGDQTDDGEQTEDMAEVEA
jgi:signal transduction histidine kinase